MKIAGIAAVAVLVFSDILVAADVPTRGIFKRCDGLPDPIERITISSCPDSDKIGYCQLRSNEYPRITLGFIPGKWRHTVSMKTYSGTKHQQTEFTNYIKSIHPN